MKTFSTRVLPSLLCLSIPALMTLTASAQERADTRLQPVELHGTSVPEPRVDVIRACPDISASLQDSLAGAVYRHGASGEMEVHFQLKGAEVAAVQTKGGPREMRAPMRRAVRDVACASDQQANQHYAFRVVFRQEDELPADQRVAVITGQRLASKD